MSAAEVLDKAESLLQSRRLVHAIATLNHAELLGASLDRCSSGRWLAAMLRGDFSAAWRESDAIRARGAHDPNRFWQGEEFRGKRVIVRCLHGFGDTVQFLRYVPLLRSLTSGLIVEVPPAMLEIAPCFEGVDEVVTWGERAPSNRRNGTCRWKSSSYPTYFARAKKISRFRQIICIFLRDSSTR